MNGEENIDQAPKNNDTREDVNDNASQEQAIEQSKTQSENMEVHHHPNVEKKGFKEYLLEGLMIFLAVTMGFFAEQIREHHVEKERLHNYFGSMVLDIDSNITALDSAIGENSKMVFKYDSIVKSFLNSGDTLNRATFAQNMGAIWYRGFYKPPRNF